LCFLLSGCTPPENPVNAEQLNNFATRYTAAWCSQNATSVASFYSESGSLQINDGDSSVGTDAITIAAQGFMTAFPNMVVEMNEVTSEGDHVIYHWTLIGTNTGPDGTGNAVRINGYEQWTISADNLIAESRGNFDAVEYQRQLEFGIGDSDN
jgi:predicted ester cyclase